MRYATSILLILIILTLILNSFLNRINSTQIVLTQNDSIINEFKEFRHSLQVRDEFSSQSVEEYISEVYYKKINQTNSQNDTILKSYNTEYTRLEKLSLGETISLNEVDTTQWKKIPGIGSAYSSRIVKYQALLGGYVCKEQLMEVYGIDNELYSQISPYIEADSNYIKLNVNYLGFRDLLRHPYLNYKQVQAIVDLREKKGNIALINELAMLDEFTSDDIIRLEPYLLFL